MKTGSAFAVRALLAFAVFSVLVCSGAHISKAEEPIPLPVTEVAQGVFVHQGRYELAAAANGGAIANIGFVIGSNGVAVIDTGGSKAEGGSLRAAIRAKTDKPVLYVINTHMHPDHILGNAAFQGEATFIGHHKLTRALAARGDGYLAKARDLIGASAMEGTVIVPPSVPVEDRMTIDLGGRTLEIVAYPTAHTDNDLTILDANTKTLFTGDLLFVHHTPSLDGSLKGWIAVIDKIKAQAADRAVPGHGPSSVPWPKAVEMEEAYLKRLKQDVKDAIRDGVTIGDAARTAGIAARADWELFDDYNSRNVIAAYAELEWE